MKREESIYVYFVKASELKWVNFISNIIGVKSPWFGSFHNPYLSMFIFLDYNLYLWICKFWFSLFWLSFLYSFKITKMVNDMEASEPIELTPMIFNTGLIHLGSEASIFKNVLYKLFLFFVLFYQVIPNLELCNFKY